VNRIPFLLTSLRVTLAPIVVALAPLAPSRGALGGCLVAAFLSDAFEPSAIADRWRPLAALVVLELARYASDFVKFRREASYHMWSSKLWGIALFTAFFSLLALGSDNRLVDGAIYLGIVVDLEGLAISTILPRWRSDVLTVVHALRLRGIERA